MPLVCAIALLLTSFALAGCGGSAPVARVSDGRVAVTLDEYLIGPQDIDVPPGRVTFTVINHGRLRHSFHLWGADGEPVAIKSLFGGDSATRSATLKPGEYRMVCTIMNHAELGMTGRLIVR
jgi:plastocyanin